MSLKLPAILGFEFSGIVDKVGLSVTKFKTGTRSIFKTNFRNFNKSDLGDEVFGRTDSMGSYAELVAVNENDIVHKPKYEFSLNFQ